MPLPLVKFAEDKRRIEENLMRDTIFWDRLKISKNSDMKSIFQIVSVFLILIVFASIFSKGVFLQPNNLLNLLTQNVILSLLALGQLLVVLTGGIDLSIGAVVGLSSVLVVLFQDYGLGVSLIIALGASMLIGFLNGSIVSFRRLPPFVVTLAMMLITYSVTQIMTGGASVYTGRHGAEIASGLINFYKQSFLGLPYPILLGIIAFVAVSLYLRTSNGHLMYTVGGNERAAFLSGVSVSKVRILAYALSSFLAGIGGILLVARVGMGAPDSGTLILLDSIAAVTIGGASLSGGVGTVVGTLMGVLILSTLNNLMNLLNVSPAIQPAVKGIVILVAVYLNSRKKNN